MKPLTFSSKSWHYQLARFGYPRRDISNICSYTRSVISGSLLLLMFLMLAVIVLYCVADALAWAAALAVTWSWLEPGLAATFVIFVVSTAAMVAAMFAVFFVAAMGINILFWIATRMRNHASSDDFVPAAISSWWHKFCVPVKIVNKE